MVEKILDSKDEELWCCLTNFRKAFDMIQKEELWARIIRVGDLGWIMCSSAKNLWIGQWQHVVKVVMDVNIGNNRQHVVKVVMDANKGNNRQHVLTTSMHNNMCSWWMWWMWIEVVNHVVMCSLGSDGCEYRQIQGRYILAQAMISSIIKFNDKSLQVCSAGI